MTSRKLHKAMPVVVSTLLLGAGLALAQKTMGAGNGKGTPHSAAPMSRSIEFRPDKMYEFAMLRVKPEKQQQLMQYFGTVFPMARKYGVRPMVSFIPVNTFAGDVRPSMFFVNEWPSEEAFRNFVSDREVKKHFPVRDDALEQLINTHTRVPQPVKVSLKEGDIVEFAALWIKPGKGGQLNEYFGQAMPVAMKYGLKPLSPFQPIGAYAGDFMPQMMSLNQWPSMEAFRKFIKDPQLGKLIPKRDDALTRMVVIHSKVHLEAEGK